MHQEREERDAKEMKSRECRKKRDKMKQREREREENGQRMRRENNFYGVPSNIHNTYLTLPLLFYISLLHYQRKTKLMVFQPQLYALVLSTQLDLYALTLNTSQL